MDLDASGTSMRDAIEEAFVLIDSTPAWKPGTSAKAHLRKAFELYSDAEFLYSSGEETEGILKSADALGELEAASSALDALTTNYGFPKHCGHT